MLISEEYRALNRQLHQDVPEYGSYGANLLDPIKALAQSIRPGKATVLDYGCGKGTLKTRAELEAASQLEITNYDPAMPAFDKRPEGKFDLVVCTDVLEHIEPDCIAEVLGDLHSFAEFGVLLTVSIIPAKKTLADGRNAHLLQRGVNWWINRLTKYSRIFNFQMMASSPEQPPHAFLYIGQMFK